jgi:hypothetical protein
MVFLTGNNVNPPEGDVWTSNGHLDGTWYDCIGVCLAEDGTEGPTGNQWRVFTWCHLLATMYRCKGGHFSFVGDGTPTGALGVDQTHWSYLAGKLYQCEGGDGSFASCTNFGSPTLPEAVLVDCVAGNNSFSIGREFAGLARGCRAGINSFAGYSGTNTDPPALLSGQLEDCIAAGGNSFGQGRSTATISGTVLRCRNGSVSNYGTGVSGASLGIFTGAAKDCHPYAPTARTAAAQLFGFDSGHTFTNAGATGSVPLTLPPASQGMQFTFAHVVAQNLVIQASTGNTINAGSVGKKYSCTSGNTTDTVTLLAVDSTHWVVKSQFGTWANDNT